MDLLLGILIQAMAIDHDNIRRLADVETASCSGEAAFRPGRATRLHVLLHIAPASAKTCDTRWKVLVIGCSEADRNAASSHSAVYLSRTSFERKRILGGAFPRMVAISHPC